MGNSVSEFSQYHFAFLFFSSSLLVLPPESTMPATSYPGYSNKFSLSPRAFENHLVALGMVIIFQSCQILRAHFRMRVHHVLEVEISPRLF